MRRRVADYPQGHMFRGREFARLMTMLGMLLVLGMLIHRASDESVWNFFGPGQAPEKQDAAAVATAAPSAATTSGTAAAMPDAKQQVPKEAKPQATKAVDEKQIAGAEKPSTQPPAPPKLVATGPTDEDSEEAGEMDNERQALTDNTTYIQKEEMFAYTRAVRWVANQPLELLRKRAKKDVIYDQFIADPEEMRFQLVQLDLNVRLVRKCDILGPNGEELSELWGYTDESGDHLYDAVVLDRPKDIPLGKVFEKAKVFGYFFKLQGYEPGGAKPNARPLIAPLIIGRVFWQPAVVPKVETTDWTGGLIALAVVVGVGVVWYFIMGRKSTTLIPASTVSSNPDAPTLDEWLGEQNDGDAHDIILGNSSSRNGESNNGESIHKDIPDEGRPRFGDADTLGR
jgi:hypothetical protein